MIVRAANGNRRRGVLAVLPVLVWAGGAAAGMVVERWAVGPKAAHPSCIRLLDAGGGAFAIQVDLQGLPERARVYRARLFVRRGEVDPTGPEAITGCEVFPLAAPFQAGEPPRRAEQRLAACPTARNCLDATRTVRRWAGDPRSNHGLYVRSCPGWVRDGTELEIAYEGKVRQVPEQVDGLEVFHRAGQTFITWRETCPLITAETATWGQIKHRLRQAGGAAPGTGAGYCLYVHDRPIDANTIASARLLGRVGPLSGYNCNGRNVEYLIGQAMIEPDQLGELAGDRNRLIDSWHMDHPRMDRYPVSRFVIRAAAAPQGKTADGPLPLPPGTGLYVHSPKSPGKRYYAVVSCLDGTENTLDFSAGNSLPEPVAETVGEGVPVCQGDGLRGPFFDYPGRRRVYVQWAAPPLAPRPNAHFNWSVLVPPDVKTPAPVELYFHRANHSYAKPARKLLLGSIQIAPHDYPPSGWYGYNEGAGALTGCGESRVGDHTQKRILAFLDWARREFPIDPDRILGVGWDGAALTALHNPDLFAYVLIEGFEAGVLDPQKAGRFASAWGPRSPEIRDDDARSAWGWAELDKLVLPRREVSLPLLVCKGYSWGRSSLVWGKGLGRFYQALQTARQPVVADWTWAGGRLIVPNKYTGRWRGLDITRLAPVPALTGSSLDSDKEANGQMNMAYLWKHVQDAPDRFAITLVNHSREATVSLTPRRLRRFRPAAGERLAWRAERAASPNGSADVPPARGGTVVTDAAGLFTIPKLKVPARAGLRISVSRAK